MAHTDKPVGTVDPANNQKTSRVIGHGRAELGYLLEVAEVFLAYCQQAILKVLGIPQLCRVCVSSKFQASGERIHQNREKWENNPTIYCARGDRDSLVSVAELRN